MSETKKNEMSFEDALKRLETLVASLESGSADLNASLAAFEEGISLVRFCTEELENAEQKVKILLTDGEGTHAVPFEG